MADDYWLDESSIRDLLAKDLDKLEPGLQLISKESRLENPAGSYGKIDILARDIDGHFVVIELKRARVSSRQAIQELAKYTALLAANHNIHEYEVRGFLVSTIWTEIDAAVSNLIGHTPFSIECFQIDVDKKTKEIKIAPHTSVNPGQAVIMSDTRYLFTYDSAKGRDDAFSDTLEALQDTCRAAIIAAGENVQRDRDKYIIAIAIPASIEEDDFLWERLTEAAHHAHISHLTPAAIPRLTQWDYVQIEGVGLFGDDVVHTTEGLLRRLRTPDTVATEHVNITYRSDSPSMCKYAEDLISGMLPIDHEWRHGLTQKTRILHAELGNRISLMMRYPTFALYGSASEAFYYEDEFLPQIILQWEGPSGKGLLFGAIYWDSSFSIGEMFAIMSSLVFRSDLSDALISRSFAAFDASHMASIGIHFGLLNDGMAINFATNEIVNDEYSLDDEGHETLRRLPTTARSMNTLWLETDLWQRFSTS